MEDSKHKSGNKISDLKSKYDFQKEKEQDKQSKSQMHQKNRKSIADNKIIDI